MKKFLLLAVCTFLLFGVLECKQSEKEEIVYSKVMTRLEGLIEGGACASGLWFFGKKICKNFEKGNLVDNQYFNIGAPVVGLVLGYIFSNWGYTNRYTSSSYLKSAMAILDKSGSDPKLLKGILNLNEETASEFVSHFTKKYGYVGVEKALKRLKFEVEKSQKYLFQVIERKDLSNSELKNLNVAKKMVALFLKKIEYTEKLFVFKKYYDDAKKLLEIKLFSGDLTMGKKAELFYGKNALQKIQEHINKIEQVKKELVSGNGKIPFSCIKQEDFNQILSNLDVALRESHYAKVKMEGNKAVESARSIISGNLIEKSLIRILKDSWIPSVEDVLNFCDKYPLLEALERLRAVQKEVDGVIKNLPPGREYEKERADLKKIAKNAGLVSRNIRNDFQFDVERSKKEKDEKIEIRAKEAKLKEISCKNEKLELEKEIKKFETKRKKYDCQIVVSHENIKKLEKERDSLRRDLEKQKFMTVNQINARLELERKLKEVEKRYFEAKKNFVKASSLNQDDKKKITGLQEKVDMCTKKLSEIDKKVDKNEKEIKTMGDVFQRNFVAPKPSAPDFPED